MRFAIRTTVFVIVASFLVMQPFAQAEHFVPGTVDKPNLNEEVVVILDFEEGSGTTAMDKSGNGNHGELMSGAEWVAGKFGGGVSLGPSLVEEAFQRVEIAPDESHAVHNFTIMGYYKLNGKIGNDSFFIDKSCWDCSEGLPRNFSLWDHTNPRILLSGWRSDGAKGQAGDFVAGTRQTEGADLEIHDGESWHHVGGSYDGQVLRSYIDGNLEGEMAHAYGVDDPGSPAYLFAPIIVGALGPHGTSHGFPAGSAVDEVVIASYAIDDDDIKAAVADGACSVFDCAGTAVESQGKLATTWAAIRSH